jgi:hypothetical protein
VRLSRAGTAAGGGSGHARGRGGPPCLPQSVSRFRAEVPLKASSTLHRAIAGVLSCHHSAPGMLPGSRMLQVPPCCRGSNAAEYVESPSVDIT